MFRRYWPLVCGYLVRRTGDLGVGEDLAQETFTRATRAFLGWRGEAPAAWLLAIARNVLTDHARRGHRLVPLDDSLLDAGLADPRPSPEARAELADLLARLPEPQQRVLELVYVVGLSHAEVAAVLQTTPAAVKTLAWRARASLRTLYRQGDAS